MDCECESDITRPMSPLTIIMFLLLLLVFSPASTGGQQRFLEQPWDLTVVAGDKVSRAVLADV